MSQKPGEPSKNRIPALDGVRAVAVLVFMAFHVHTPGFSAGLLGVDAFFVLSGFLITGLLLRDVSVYGRIRLANFWSRRVRRLVPAVLVMVTGVVTWGAFSAPVYQLDALRADITATLLDVANWRFISSSSYFTGDGVTSPLEHTWSLAVEEQFYLLWPLLLTLAVLVIRRRYRARGGPIGASVIRVVAILSAVGVAISAGLLAWFYDPSAPERAYMGTDARAFEPLLGALLACLATSERFRTTVRRYAGSAIVLGLAGLALGVLLLGADGATGTAPAYYRGGAFAVSVACGLMVLGAAHGRTDNPVVRLPAIGVTITNSQGALLVPKTNCGDVIPPLQTQSIKEFAPTIVVAWSRYEMADRLSSNGKHLVAGTAPFWQAQRMSLRTMIARMTSGGAKVVFVKTDRPGQGMATRCTPAACTPLLKRLVTQDGLRVTWNKILDEEAALNPRMTVIALDDVYCKDAAEPCNDRLPDGTFARPDGSHFSKAYMPVVAKVLAQRIAAAVK